MISGGEITKTLLFSEVITSNDARRSIGRDGLNKTGIHVKEIEIIAIIKRDKKVGKERVNQPYVPPPKKYLTYRSIFKVNKSDINARNQQSHISRKTC